MKKKFFIGLTIILCLCIAGGLWKIFQPLTSSDNLYLFIDKDDTADSVKIKVEQVAKKTVSPTWDILSKALRYKDRVHTGRYWIEPGENILNFLRKLRSGMQTPLRLTIPSVRTMDRLATILGQRLMEDSTTWNELFCSPEMLQAYGCDTTTLPALFIPNTYEMYWDITPEKFMRKMKREHDNFWNEQRTQQAKALMLTPNQVTTLASIIDEETANNAEKPMIAGMYINRLQMGMPLQADPTIKFALQNFELKRIWQNLLSVESPYNTYQNEGLPPGPIRIASVAGIDAVLHAVKHDYLYMCAKEDFSGTHNFACTYAEHLQNAHKYSQALNQRGIK